MLLSVVQVPCIFPLPPCSLTQLPGSHAGEPQPDTHALHTCWERLGRKHSCLLFKLKRTTSGVCVLCLDTYAQLGLHRAAPTLVGRQRWHERPHFSHICYSYPILTFSYPPISLLRKKAPASLFRRKGSSGTQGVSPLCVLFLCTPCPRSLATDGCCFPPSSHRLLQGGSPGHGNSPAPCTSWSPRQCEVLVSAPYQILIMFWLPLIPLAIFLAHKHMAGASISKDY